MQTKYSLHRPASRRTLGGMLPVICKTPTNVLAFGLNCHHSPNPNPEPLGHVSMCSHLLHSITVILNGEWLVSIRAFRSPVVVSAAPRLNVANLTMQLPRRRVDQGKRRASRSSDRWCKVAGHTGEHAAHKQQQEAAAAHRQSANKADQPRGAASKGAHKL